MSLSSELQNPNSIMSRFLNRILDPVESRVLLHNWNLKLQSAHTLRMTSDVNPALVGTAFDYAFRWTLSNHLIASELVAFRGAKMADNQRYQYHVSALNTLVSRGNQTPHLRPAISIILSWYERIFRSGNYKPVLSCFKSVSTSSSETVKNLTANVPLSEFTDIQQLVDTISEVWGKRLQREYILNPILPNSGYVGGADGDWIIDSVLYDCKCSWRSSPFTMDHLKQVLAYALLDWDDELKLRGIGWYYARQKMLVEYPLEELLPDVSAKRAELKALYVAKHHQYAVNHKNLNQHLEDILWKHHGDKITSDIVLFPWEHGGWGL